MIGFINGFFGSGGGIIAVPFLVMLLKMEQHNSHATSIFIIFPISILSIFFYIKNNYMDWNVAFKVILGGMIGGFIGAKLLNRFSTNFLRRTFAVFMIIAAIKMLV